MQNIIKNSKVYFIHVVGIKMNQLKRLIEFVFMTVSL